MEMILHYVRNCWRCSSRELPTSVFFFFKQKTAYEMRSSDWSSDVCSSDLKAVLECIGEKDIAEAGRDHSPETIIAQSPYGMFARRAAAEVLLRDHAVGLAVGLLVQHEGRIFLAVFIAAQIATQELVDIVRARPLPITGGNDRVGSHKNGRAAWRGSVGEK